jgi:hypothetical protein
MCLLTVSDAGGCPVCYNDETRRVPKLHFSQVGNRWFQPPHLPSYWSKELAGKRNGTGMNSAGLEIGSPSAKSRQIESKNSAFFNLRRLKKVPPTRVRSNWCRPEPREQAQTMSPAVHQCASIVHSRYSKKDWELGNHPILVRPSMTLQLCGTT